MIKETITLKNADINTDQLAGAYTERFRGRFSKILRPPTRGEITMNHKRWGNLFSQIDSKLRPSRYFIPYARESG